MLRSINLVMLFTILAVLCQQAMAQPSLEDLETFQVPDLSPPTAPNPSDIEAIPAPPGPVLDEEGIPATSGYPGTALGLLDGVPVPYAHPSTHLWAGYCNGCETLVAPCPCSPTWVSLDAFWLKRQGPDTILLATDGGQENLRTDQFKFDYEPGVRVTYGEVVNCTPVEITYFGFHDWNSSIALDAGGLDVPVGPDGGAFDGANFVEASYSSELHSLEVNVLQFRDDRLTWVTGIRYIDAEEDFLLRVDNGNQGGMVITGDNRLLGLQGGANYSRGCNGWCYTAYGRAGLFVNFAERDFRIRDEGFPDNNAVGENNDTEFAFVGQIGVGLTRHLGYGLKLRGGYELLWIDGLTLAAEQLGAGGLAPMNTNGETLYDGGYLGLEWTR